MKSFLSKILLLGVIVALLAGCFGNPPAPTEPEVSPTLEPSPTLPDPSMRTTPAPDAEAAARQYLDSWAADDYTSMYAMLTGLSRDAVEFETFETRYRTVASEAALQGLHYEILSSLTNPRSAQVGYRIVLESSLVGEISRDTIMNLSLENGAWHIQWDDSLILPELVGGNTLWMDRYIPARANIYDRSGNALVAQADAVSIGLDTSRIDFDRLESLLTLIYQAMGSRPDYHPNVIQPRVENYARFGWYLPVGEVSSDAFGRYENAFSGYDGVILRNYRSRFYFDGGAAPHVIGYVSALQTDELETFLRQGYARDERVGRAGLERWGESSLSGTRGGALYVISPGGQVVTRLAEKESSVSQAIYTTLDRNLQLGAQRALAGFNGAIVAVELETGRILAMASSPAFDPNAFEYTNPNSSALLQDLFANPEAPFLNRATQGLYPLGSVFKIFTMAAAMDSGVYTPASTYECGYFFTELPGITLNDWTYERFQRGDNVAPSGLLTLPEGLMRSCNPYFWHIGLNLFNLGRVTDISQMARDFGLGQATRVLGLLPEEERAGNIPDPTEQVDAVNISIGQGAVQVTPIQIAMAVAAIGNGGTIYRPQLIERIEPPGDEPTFVFEPEENGQLPLDEDDLRVLQEAMVSVVANRRGTANFVLGPWSTSNRIPIAGKTGTAEDPPRPPHAWFAGYTFAGRENRPDIAVVVIIENVGEGSEFGAPVFKAMLEIYFNGQRATRFPWESSLGVLATPTPQVDDTEVIEETPEP
jgi:cell division protein FtsI/penicillin-binding protein 2